MRTFYVYVHTNKVNNKKYFGITCQAPQKRWGKDGCNYLRQYKNGKYMHAAFACAILKYGWAGFCHEILFEGLSETEAKRIEKDLIAKYNTTHSDFGYNLTLGGDGHCIHRTEEERLAAKQATVAKSLAKLNADPIRKEKDTTRRREYANTKYANLKNNPEEYELVKEAARTRAAIRQADPVEHKKILEARKRCAKKAAQDPAKKAKKLDANTRAKQVVREVRNQLIDLHTSRPELFSEEDCIIIFTKFSAESGCYKYNSAKQLQQILDKVIRISA
jgi:hypothetical protein